MSARSSEGRNEEAMVNSMQEGALKWTTASLNLKFTDSCQVEKGGSSQFDASL